MDISRLKHTLHQLGITQQYCGYQQLIDSVELAMADESRLCSSHKEIFEVIPSAQNRSWRNVERNLRTLSQKAWQTDRGLLQKLAIYPLQKEPSAVELVVILCNYMLRSEGEDVSLASD